MHRNNPEIIKLSRLLGRTPSSIALKLVNFASLDPSLKQRGVVGMSNTSRLDREVWSEIFNDWEVLVNLSSEIDDRDKTETISTDDQLDEIDLQIQGVDRERLVRTRVNQGFFRSVVLSSYNYTCCITGTSIPEILIAGHIVPWSEDERNRLNPRNGICINSLHDKAYENGLIAIAPDYSICISKRIKESKDSMLSQFFLAYEGRKIIMPSRFLPDPNLLEVKYEKFLQQN